MKILEEMIRVLKNIYFLGERGLFLLLKLSVTPFIKKDVNAAILWAVDASPDKIDDILKRAVFYIPDINVKVVKKRTGKDLFEIAFSDFPILFLNDAHILFPFWYKALRRQRKVVFHIDYELTFSDGWVWHDVINYFYGKDLPLEIQDGQKRFFEKVRSLKALDHSKCYVFGTGPSLGKAIERDWSDGYRLVCNTIVRDPELWKHLNPHFIVAGDAIYHFGHTNFAKAFRADLHRRLEESDAVFVYPAWFHSFVKREFEAVKDRLIPIPIGKHQSINLDLTKEYSLPGLGNVLPALLLPLACTLSREIYLCGFDGRAPDDKLSWKNSNKHTYSEYLQDLQKAHPAFFEYFLSKQNPQKYVKDYHGDILDERMKVAEEAGWKFVMMHPSWTPIFQKRYDSKAWGVAQGFNDRIGHGH
jgi:hypothetical protein